MPQAEELEEAGVGEAVQAEVEAGRFEFPNGELIVKVEATFPWPAAQSADVSCMFGTVWKSISCHLFNVRQLQQFCWKDEQEPLPEDESGDEHIVDKQSDKAGESSGFDFMAARNKTMMLYYVVLILQTGGRNATSGGIGRSRSWRSGASRS